MIIKENNKYILKAKPWMYNELSTRNLSELPNGCFMEYESFQRESIGLEMHVCVSDLIAAGYEDMPVEIEIETRVISHKRKNH